MEITDIIGDGKIFEPPFRVEVNPLNREATLVDGNGKVLLYSGAFVRTSHYWQDRALLRHFCDLLNREHGR